MEIQNIIDILKCYFTNQPVIKAWLFGSMSRGEASPESDVDILVAFDEGVGLVKYASMINDLQDLLNKSIDLVTESSLLPWVKESVEKEKVLIYERKTA